jgi:hypothetical protein
MDSYAACNKDLDKEPTLSGIWQLFNFDIQLLHSVYHPLHLVYCHAVKDERCAYLRI